MHQTLLLNSEGGRSWGWRKEKEREENRRKEEAEGKQEGPAQLASHLMLWSVRACWQWDYAVNVAVLAYLLLGLGITTIVADDLILFMMPNCCEKGMNVKLYYYFI